MSHRPAPAVAVCTTLLLAALSALPFGCKKEEAAPSAPPPAASAAIASPNAQTLENIRFESPDGWKAQPGAQSGLTVVGPRDGDWEPNISFEINENKNDRSVDEILTEALEILARKPEFESKGRQSDISHLAGFQYGRIAYVSKNKSELVQLFQWYIAIPLPNKRWLEIQASAPAEGREKYEPAFQKVINSIKIVK